MAAHLAICPIGVFACDETGKLIDKELFERNSEHVARKILQLKGGTIIPELKILYERVRKKHNEIILEHKNNFGLEVQTEIPNLCGKVLRQQIRDLASEFGFHPIEHFVYNLGIALTEETLQIELSRPDKRIIQVIGALEELDETTNVLSERLREWYLIFHPELIKQIDKHETFARLIAKGKVDKKDSIGGNFNDSDLNTLKFFAQSVSESFS